MKRLAFALHLALTILVSPAAAEPSMLNDSVMVRGSYVRLGDLFSNAGAHADAVVAYAPAPGKRAVFDANWLYRVAYRYKLPWRPLSLQDRAVVRRVSQVITREDIENRILAELRRRGYTSDVRVVLGNSALRLHIAGDKPATMAVEDFTYDRRSKRFTGVVVAPAGDPAAPRVRVTGRIYEIAEIPVLARGISRQQGHRQGRHPVDQGAGRPRPARHRPRRQEPRRNGAATVAALRHADPRRRRAPPGHGDQGQHHDHRPEGTGHVADRHGPRPRGRQQGRRHPGFQHPEQHGVGGGGRRFQHGGRAVRKPPCNEVGDRP